MTRWGPLAAIITLALLTACERSGPPAPVTYQNGPPPSRASGSGSAAPAAATPARPRSSTASSNGSPAHNPLPSSTAEAPPPPPPPPPPTSPAQGQAQPPAQIVVAKGDTVYTVARRYNVPLRSIIDANDLDPPFQLVEGTTLNLPQERFYTVAQGDTLYSISRNYGVELSTLADLNHLAEPYTLQTGQSLELPPSVEPPTPAPETKPAAPGTVPPPNKPAATAQAPVPPASSSAQNDQPVIPPRVGKGFDWPLQGRIIERYGTGPNGTHNDGINIAARAGEPVRAADAGTVAYAGNELRGYGNLILIKHAGGYMTAYAHNSQLLVRRGDVVKRGQEIAKAGATGTVDTPQVHFEIRKGTRTVDPTSLLPSLRASTQ